MEQGTIGYAPREQERRVASLSHAGGKRPLGHAASSAVLANASVKEEDEGRNNRLVVYRRRTSKHRAATAARSMVRVLALFGNGTPARRAVETLLSPNSSDCRRMAEVTRQASSKMLRNRSHSADAEPIKC